MWTSWSICRLCHKMFGKDRTVTWWIWRCPFQDPCRKPCLSGRALQLSPGRKDPEDPRSGAAPFWGIQGGRDICPGQDPGRIFCSGYARRTAIKLDHCKREINLKRKYVLVKFHKKYIFQEAGERLQRAWKACKYKKNRPSYRCRWDLETQYMVVFLLLWQLTEWKGSGTIIHTRSVIVKRKVLSYI